MKINKIELYNLNSLKGYWCIDLTHPSYARNHNQFVIHGEIGSGKSTILDAITLALFGESPRLKRLADKNKDFLGEIITKHTNEAMASVSYECKNGKFKSTFTLKKTGKNLNRGFHITNLETGEDTGNISAKENIKKETRDRIQLDYDQFCRSILLAQGKFDTFISSTEKERAEILAKLSGSNYKELGNQIWLKARDKMKEYDDEKEKIKSVELLSSEEVEALNKEVEGIPNANANIQKNINKNNEALTWLKQVSELYDEYESANTARTNHINAVKEFEPKKVVLEKSEKALKCEASYQSYNQLVEEDDADNRSLGSKNNELSSLKQSITDADKAYKDAKKAFINHNEKKSDNQNLWKQIRNLDTQIESLAEIVINAKKRADDSQEQYDIAEKNISELNGDIKKIEDELKEINEYLTNNKADKELPEILPEVKAKTDSVKNSLSKIKNAENKKTDSNNKLSAASNQKTSETQKLEGLKSELKNLVSTEYLSISVLLRNKVEQGKACPVCGSVNHPFCENSKVEANSQKSEGADDIAIKVSEFNKSIEECESALKQIETAINNYNSEITQLDTVISSETEEVNQLKKDINSKISAWNVALETKTDADIILFDENLKELLFKAEDFKLKTEKTQSLDKDKTVKTEKLKGINISNLKTILDNDSKYYSEKNTELETLTNQRSELFGNKNPDDEEEAFNKELKRLEKDRDSAKEYCDSLNIEKSKLDGEIGQLQTKIANRKNKLSEALEKFETALSKNGFESKEQFVSCRCSEEQLKELQEVSKELEKNETATKVNLENSEKKYNDCKKLNKTDKSISELTAENQKLENDKEHNASRAGEIQHQLELNKQNLQKVEEYTKKLNSLEEQNRTWESIKSFIGVKDGSEFQVFVEVMVFRQLLKRANEHLKLISKKYKLVQVPGKVDFKIHDDSFPDEKSDRLIDGMSGGERFMISLSMALGISELVSKNVKVDALFLDEGFGTLSGQPLFDAINALKALQSSGKTLGIITHVSDVINSFDQKIKAFPDRKNGGCSILEGDGISHIENFKIEKV